MSEQAVKEKRSRYERKFVISGISRPGIIQIVKSHPSAFSEIFHQRSVNNIYLDTPNLTFFQDNVVGKSRRKKVRIRWYGDLYGRIEKPILEFKLKVGAVGEKLSFRLKAFTLDENFDQNTLLESFAASDLPDWVREDILPLEPHLLNCYTRKYFLSFDKKFRTTIDNQLIYHDISRRNNSFIKKSVNETDIIVELKYNFKDDDVANSVSGNFPFRMTKSSKYVNGVEQFIQGIAM